MKLRGAAKGPGSGVWAEASSWGAAALGPAPRARENQVPWATPGGTSSLGEVTPLRSFPGPPGTAAVRSRGGQRRPQGISQTVPNRGVTQSHRAPCLPFAQTEVSCEGGSRWGCF